MSLLLSVAFQGKIGAILSEACNTEGLSNGKFEAKQPECNMSLRSGNVTHKAGSCIAPLFIIRISVVVGIFFLEEKLAGQSAAVPGTHKNSVCIIFHLSLS